MSEIRDRAKDKMAKELKVLFGNIADENEYSAIVNVLFSKVPELAIVDRGAELPDLNQAPYDYKPFKPICETLLRDMLKAGWVKEADHAEV